MCYVIFLGGDRNFGIFLRVDRKIRGNFPKISKNGIFKVIFAKKKAFFSNFGGEVWLPGFFRVKTPSDFQCRTMITAAF